MRLIILSLVIMAIGAWIAIRKPKANQESLDWVGGFVAGLGMILFLASFSAYVM